MENKISVFLWWVSVLHFAVPVRIPQNPCPTVFSYYKNENGLLYGEVRVPYDGATFMVLNVNASLAARFYNKVELRLQLKTPLKQLMANVSRVTYNINFPSQEIIPKITQITYNGHVFCQGPPEPLIPGSQGITNVWYTTTFQFTRIPQGYLIEDHQDPGIPEAEIPVKDPDNIVDDTKFSSEAQKPSTPLFSSTESNLISHGGFPMQIDQQQLPATSVPVTPEAPQSSYRCGVPKPSTTPLILGGTDSAAGQFPWLAAVMSKTDTSDEFEYKCSATLVSDKHVITAGRCVQYYKVRVLKVRDMLLVMGTNDVENWRTNGAVTRKATKVDTHPDFLENSNTAHADMSVITMDNPVRFSNLLIPVCLWKGDSDLFPITDKVGTVAGYGRDERGALRTARAKYAHLKIVSQYNCLLSEIGLLRITSDKTFCAGGGGKGPCIGDSGSGLVLRKDGAYQLRGISSFTVTNNGTCDFENKYAVFCDVAKFSDWVKSCMTN